MQRPGCKVGEPSRTDPCFWMHMQIGYRDEHGARRNEQESLQNPATHYLPYSERGVQP